MKTKAGFLIVITALTALAITLGCAGRWHAGTVRNRLADTYGLQNFGQVQSLRYTFNVQLPDKQVSRSWVWEPAADRVTFQGTAAQGGPVTYLRKEIGQADEKVKKVDAWFINDNYWLLFPFHMAWDTNALVEVNDTKQPLPIGTGQARRVVVSYPPSGGYTPGDVYELFVGDDYRVMQWIYRQGGSPTPTRVTTWQDYRNVGPILIALDHEGADGKFRVWFTDVAVQLKGRADWVAAK
jgi:hypothetical protein